MVELLFPFNFSFYVNGRLNELRGLSVDLHPSETGETDIHNAIYHVPYFSVRCLV